MTSAGICIGEVAFRDLRESNLCYIDKTAFIEELLGPNRAKVSLITRPRRFGKTLTMSMLAEFFDIRKDSRAIFQGLKISRNRDLCDRWMNQYPIVFLSFKSAEGDTFEEALFQVSLIASRLCQQYSYLLDSPHVETEEKELLAILKARTREKGILSNALFTLCSALHVHHGKNPVLLIDEYDVPLAKAEEHGYYREMASFLRVMLGTALKDNPDLEFAVLTGCLRISRESIFTGLNNFVCHGISDNDFVDCFGFTPGEVETLLADFHLSGKMAEIREWYDGYRFGRNQEIYCPWDVLCYVRDQLNDPGKKPVSYWQNTSGNSIVKTFLGRAGAQTRAKVETLVDGGCVIAQVVESLTYEELYREESNLWTVLYLTGYLTRAPEETRKANAAALQGRKAECLVVPNREVLEIYKENIKFWFHRTVEKMGRAAFFAALWKGDADFVSSWITQVLVKTISVRASQENYYHGFVAGLFAGGEYPYRSNDESGEGFADIVVRDEEHSRAAVIEVKRARALADLGGKAEEALAQIREKRYAVPLADDYITVVPWGFAFFRKTCLARSERPARS